nr:odorant receptor Or1-like [Leptinotarsa decemlineata]
MRKALVANVRGTDWAGVEQMMLGYQLGRLETKEDIDREALQLQERIKKACFFFMGIVIGEVVNLFNSLGDLEATVTASFLTLSNLVSIAKFYAIAKHQEKILKLANLINRKEFKPKSDVQLLILKEYIKTSKVISGLMYGGCIFTCVFWAIYPFTEDGDVFLPIAAWIPFKTNTSPSFEIVYVYEIIATVIGGLTDLSADCLIAGFIMVICAQFKILNDSLVNIKQFAIEEMNSEWMGDDVNGEISPVLQEIMNKKLLECVIHHRYILEFSNEVYFLFTTSILGQFAVSVIIICTTLFEMTLVSFPSVKLFSLILYQYCMLMEIFIVCYFGNEVILEIHVTKPTFLWV